MEYVSEPAGLVTGEHIWKELWLFGLIEDDAVTDLGCLWQPDGHIENGYYLPDDHDTEYQCIDIDHPPSEGAWDARPINPGGVNLV